MKEKFTQYLRSIGVPLALDEKIQKAYEFYLEICPDEITDIFVTDYITNDGTREYENLWFFSEKYWMEAKQFITKENFDIVPAQKRVNYWSLEKQNYDFKRATEASRLHLSFQLAATVTGNLKASKENCDYLKDIIIKYVVPNLKE